jgi:PEP-CTERM motif-containing protein
MKLKAVALLGVVAGLSAPAFATSYTQDPSLSDFTAGITNYATLSNFSAGDVGSPFTPTSAELATTGARVYDGGSLTGLSSANNWILATFASSVGSIRVFANIDHLGSAYDGYQYTIQGSNDLATWTPLFDALTVTGSGEPFTLGTFTGTAPTTVNNVVNGPNGVGYEADFTFANSYKYYAFGASTVAFDQGNSDQELSAVAATAAVPEPESVVLMLAGLAAIGLAGHRRRKSTDR